MPSMPKAAAINLRVTAQLKKAVEKAAADDHRSVASFVEVVLIEALKARGYLK